MTRDRLTEFRCKASFSRGDEDDGDTPSENANFSNSPVQTPTNGYVAIEMIPKLDNELDQFFNQVADVKKLIDDLSSDVDTIKTLHSEILSTPIPDERKKSELNSLVSTIETNSKIIRAKLKEMEKFIAAAAEEKDQNGGAGVRIRKTQHSALLWNFIDVIDEYQIAQTEYKAICKVRLKRHLELTVCKFSEEDVENLVEAGNWSGFTQGIIMENEQAKKILADVEARHNDIKKLEKSLKEFHDLFLEMALLVESQGEIVDRIENHVAGTQEHVGKAHEQFNQARVLQSKARKKKIILISVLILLALLLCLIIFFSLL